MKGIYYLMIFAITACGNKTTSESTPTFERNSSLTEIWEPIKNIVSKKDFSIVYSEGGGAFIEQGDLTHKIICVSNGTWEKVEIKIGIKEVDTVNNSLEIIEKDLVLKKYCEPKEAKEFLDSLIRFGLFELKEEKILLEKCTELGSQVTNTKDAGRITFYLVNGNKVRTLSYYDLEQKSTDCSGIQEWSNIQRIKNLFRNKWYFNKHY